MRKQVNLFFQRPGTEEHSDIMIFTITHMMLHNLLTRPVLDFSRSEISHNFKNKHIFRKPKTPDEVGVFLQTLRDMLPVDIFFSLRKDGTIWIVEHSDAEKHMLDHYEAIGSISPTTDKVLAIGMKPPETRAPLTPRPTSGATPSE